jgi:hypothetical protein
LLALNLVVKENGNRNSSQYYKLLYNGEGKNGKRFMIGLK